jgi:hypothetical protein
MIPPRSRRRPAAPPPAFPLQPAPPQADGDLLARTGLRAAAAGIPDNHPDAPLFRALSALAEAERTCNDAHRNWNARPGRRQMDRSEAKRIYQQASAACQAHRTRVAALPARTPDGALAKLRYVLECYNENTSTYFQLPLSALQDALAQGFG